MNSDKIRRSEFRRNIKLEEYLGVVNQDLQVCEKALLKQEIEEYPIIFIMGAMRSGSTIMLQWLASTGEFAYPSNIISRFYGAPIIGSKIQRILTDPLYNFRNEIMDFNLMNSFASVNGKTKGALEPNEFWYFWRRFLPDDLRECTSDDLMERTDAQTMRLELWGISQVFDKPLALKGMICNYHISFLNKIFPKAIFISMRRNIESHTRSVLAARMRQYGTYDQWYSFLIPEYDELMKITEPEIQVRRQIECINHAIDEGLKNVPDNKKVKVDYENFCTNPEGTYREIERKLDEQGYIIGEEYSGKKYFEVHV